MKNLRTLFVLAIIQTVLLAHSGYGQFHWGSKSRAEIEKFRALVLQQLRTPGAFYHIAKVIIKSVFNSRKLKKRLWPPNRPNVYAFILFQANSESNTDEPLNPMLEDPVSVILKSRSRRGIKPYIMRCHSLGPMSMLRRCVWERNLRSMSWKAIINVIKLFTKRTLMFR